MISLLKVLLFLYCYVLASSWFVSLLLCLISYLYTFPCEVDLVHKSNKKTFFFLSRSTNTCATTATQRNSDGLCGYCCSCLSTLSTPGFPSSSSTRTTTTSTLTQSGTAMKVRCIVYVHSTIPSNLLCTVYRNICKALFSPRFPSQHL